MSDIQRDVFGFNNSNWISAMNGFSSAKVYKERIEDFFRYQLDRDGDFIDQLSRPFSKFLSILEA
jgi:hypothetical protein